MSVRWQGAFLVGLASSGVDLDDAARRLLAEGLDREVLPEVEAFVRQLDLDPSARDRALLLLERTRVLAERARADARVSDRLRATAATQTSGVAASLVDLSFLWRHELATPLAVTQMALETLAAAPSDPAMVERLVDVARRNLRLASHLLQGLSSIGDLQAGRVELSWAEVDVEALVRECADDVQSVLTGQHEIVVVAERAVAAPADRDAVRQILVNLLTNAAKFSPVDSPIEVTVEGRAEHVEVAVRDRGSGLSPQDAERIFEAGERLDAETPGMGLGLFIARQLARAHGGDLHVQHPSSGGSRFVLRLPRSPALWQHSLERRERADDARDARRREQAAVAADRDDLLDQREARAKERDDVLDERELVAGRRDADADARDAAADARDAAADARDAAADARDTAADARDAEFDRRDDR